MLELSCSVSLLSSGMKLGMGTPLMCRAGIFKSLGDMLPAGKPWFDGILMTGRDAGCDWDLRVLPGILKFASLVTGERCDVLRYSAP